MKGIIAVPAYNEENVIKDVVLSIPRRIGLLSLDIVVVNDGSTDQTAREVKKTRATLISHPVNRGLGAALGTGFEFARRQNYDLLVTIDGDGQHDPREIPKIIQPILKNQADFVVGTRVVIEGMPVTRRFLTFFASLITYFFTGVWTSDSQSGFRAFSKRAIDKIAIQVDRMEVSSDFFGQCREKKLRIIEVPIKPIYTKYSLAKGQNILNSFNIVSKLTLQKLIK